MNTEMTAGQLTQIYNLAKQQGCDHDKTDTLLTRGTFADFLRADPTKVNRVELRKVLGMKSLVRELSEAKVTTKVPVPAIAEKKTSECFQSEGKFTYFCQRETDKYWEFCDRAEVMAMRPGFDAALLENQPATPPGTLIACPVKKGQYFDDTLHFARYIVGMPGTEEEVSQLLIKNGYCVTLPMVEVLLKGLLDGSAYLKYSTAGIMFFIQNREGTVSVLHFKGGRNGYLCDGAGFVLRPLADGQMYGSLLGHEHFVVNEVA
jgi:hypothetical protein